MAIQNKNRADGKFNQVEQFLEIAKKLGIPSITGDVLEGTGTPIPIYFNTTTNKLRVYVNGAFQDATDLQAYYTKLETDAFLETINDNVSALQGLHLVSDQANQVFKLLDGDDNELSTISVAFLNNEGTTFIYNDTTGNLELRNEQDELLSEIPVSSFVSNIAKNIRFNGSTPYTLELIDETNSVLGSVNVTINNISGLTNALAGKEPAFNVLSVTKGGTGLDSINNEHFLVGGLNDTISPRSINETKQLLGVKDITDQQITNWDSSVFTPGVGLVKTGDILSVDYNADSFQTNVNQELELKETGVTAGRMTSVFVDKYGRITSGSVGLSEYSFYLNYADGDDATAELGNINKPYKNISPILTLIGALPVAQQNKAVIYITDKDSYTIFDSLGSGKTIPVQCLNIVGLSGDGYATVTFRNFFALISVKFININISVNLASLIEYSFMGGISNTNIFDVNILRVTGVQTLATTFSLNGNFSVFKANSIVFENYSYIGNLGASTGSPIVIGSLVNNSTLFNNGRTQKTRFNTPSGNYNKLIYHIGRINSLADTDFDFCDFNGSQSTEFNIQAVEVSASLQYIVNLRFVIPSGASGSVFHKIILNGSKYSNLFFDFGTMKTNSGIEISGNPYIEISTLIPRSHMRFIGSNKTKSEVNEPLILRNYNPSIYYDDSVSYPIVDISQFDNNALYQKQMVLDNCIIYSNVSTPVFGIASTYNTDVSQLIIFKNHIKVKNGISPLFNCDIVPTARDFVKSVGAFIEILSALIETNNRIKIDPTRNIVSKNIIPVTSNLTLTNEHHEAILVIDANVIITVPANLLINFTVDIDVLPTRQASFSAASGVTITGNAGLNLLADKMATLYMRSVGNNFRLKGETSA